MTQKRLLVAEDDPVLRDLLVEMLTGEGFDVTCRGGGPDQAPPDLILGGAAPDNPAQLYLELARPVRLGPLLARIRDRLAQGPGLTVGPWVLDLAARRLAGPQGNVRLTDKETRILALLAKHPCGVERERLLREVWGYGAGVDTHTLETHIYRLRRKLAEGGQPDLLQTLDGGYGLEQ